MFFRRKKEKVVQEKPLKYYIMNSVSETEFTCSVSYTEGMHNTKFTEIGYALMEAVLSEYCVFTVRHIIGDPEELERCLAYMKQEPTAEFISDEKEMVIEKGKGVSSFLLNEYWIVFVSGLVDVVEERYKHSGRIPFLYQSESSLI